MEQDFKGVASSDDVAGHGWNYFSDENLKQVVAEVEDALTKLRSLGEEKPEVQGHGYITWSDENLKQVVATWTRRSRCSRIWRLNQRARDGLRRKQCNQQNSPDPRGHLGLERSRPDEAQEQPGMGVIAQEIERVFPHLVTIDEHGRRKVAYHGLVAPLIEAVKELDAWVRSLEADQCPDNLNNRNYGRLSFVT